MPLSPTDFANDGDSPLLVEIKSQRWDEAFKYLPTTKNSNDDDNDNDNDDDRTKKLIMMIQTPDEYGNLPLHAAIGFHAPDKFLLQLIDAYPTACTIHGSDDWTPLHVAAMYGCSYTVMERIILTYPMALDDDGSGTGLLVQQQLLPTDNNRSTSSNNDQNQTRSTKSSVKRKTPRHYAGKHSPEIQKLLLRPTKEWIELIEQQQGKDPI